MAQSLIDSNINLAYNTNTGNVAEWPKAAVC